MGINIKYYIISIAAIFISLGIGIFIGFNMNGQEIYFNQQQALVDSLEERFIEFKKDKEDLEQNIQNLNAEKEKQGIFIENIFYEAIKDKLLGVNVAIIETTSNYFYDDINNTLRLSGAFVPIHIKYKDKIYNVTDEQLHKINELFNVQLEKNDDFINFINDEVVDSFVFKDISDILKFLMEEEYIEYIYNFNIVDDLNIDKIIIAGGNDKNQKYKAEKLNVDLIKNLQQQQFNIIGIERLDVEQSYIPIFKKFNISTVDNVDNKMGKVSLVYLLNNEQGHYGEKSTADSLAPFVIVDTSQE